MAGLYGQVDIPATTLSSTVARTVVQLLAATNQRVRLLGVEFAGNGTSGTDGPVQGRIIRQSSAGTSTGATVVKIPNFGSETVQTSGFITFTSTEPTVGTVVQHFAFSPQSNYRLLFVAPLDYVMVGGERLGIELTSPNGCTIDGYLKFEE